MKKLSLLFAAIGLLSIAALSGCTGSMPCNMVIAKDGKTVYEALITLTEKDNTEAEIWQRTGKPRNLPLIPVTSPETGDIKGKTSLVLEGDLKVTLANTPIGRNKSVSLKKLELVRATKESDMWYLPKHQIKTILAVLKGEK